MARPYKWQPHEGSRHAISQELAANEVGNTLCDLEVTASTDKWADSERCWPTCKKCDAVWREHEHLLPWPRPEKSKRSPAVEGDNELDGQASPCADKAAQFRELVTTLALLAVELDQQVDISAA
ncbi:hypothetical protein Lesp02_42570 [Lentzea sp. NBRC 105346]|uniref:zinc finger protein n=1 Tax=Lentzea sp. NBRC 105346 TaxID=3032205 RepID=UPI0024A47BD0|nr:zinc finger protein [Lentzea sp. NBRC 105346]GLZ32069.1 hypothetical protein Lesp02_42570 [Lentzea sp. NBRC 105346]